MVVGTHKLATFDWRWIWQLPCADNFDGLIRIGSSSHCEFLKEKYQKEVYRQFVIWHYDQFCQFLSKNNILTFESISQVLATTLSLLRYKWHLEMSFSLSSFNLWKNVAKDGHSSGPTRPKKAPTIKSLQVYRIECASVSYSL